jgi:hypothetical protein
MKNPNIFNVLVKIPLFYRDDCESGGLEELAKSLNVFLPCESTQEEYAEAITIRIEEKFNIKKVK